MSNTSRDDVIAKFGPLDEAVTAEIIATGATPRRRSRVLTFCKYSA
jgi:hypothetical protein